METDGATEFGDLENRPLDLGAYRPKDLWRTEKTMKVHPYPLSGLTAALLLAWPLQTQAIPTPSKDFDQCLFALENPDSAEKCARLTAEQLAPSPDASAVTPENMDRKDTSAISAKTLSSAISNADANKAATVIIAGSQGLQHQQTQGSGAQGTAKGSNHLAPPSTQGDQGPSQKPAATPTKQLEKVVSEHAWKSS